MVKGGLIAADKVVRPWSNHLVISAPVGSPVKLAEWNDLTTDTIKTILIGDPGTAPFGRYTKQAMQRTGIWEQVKQKITTKKNITLLAETLARSDDHTVGILFPTNLTEQLRTLYQVDPSWHSAIHYYMAPVGPSADNAAVIELFNYIHSDSGNEIFKTAGFDLSPQ